MKFCTKAHNALPAHATTSLLNIPTLNTLSPVTHPLLALSLLLNYLSVSALIFMYMLNNSYTPCIPVTLFGLFHYVHSVYKCYAIVCLLRINL